MYNYFQYGLKQALQLLIYTLITVVVVMFVAGEKNYHKLCFPKSFYQQCLPRLCSMLLTRSSSSPADEKGVRCKPYLLEGGQM